MSDHQIGDVAQTYRQFERHRKVTFQNPEQPSLEQGQHTETPYGLSPGPRNNGGELASSLVQVPYLGLTGYWDLYTNITNTPACMEIGQLRQYLKLPESREKGFSQSIREKMKQEKFEPLSHGDSKPILPVEAFERIFTASVVKSVLREAYPLVDDKELCCLLQRVLGPDGKRERRRILAILIYMKGVQHLDYFLTKGIYDQDLPINCQNDDDYRGVESKHFGQWGENKRLLFTAYQQMVFVPVFHLRPDVLHSYGFSGHTRLPWISYESKSKGGFGVVFKVQIHPSHCTSTGKHVSTA